MVRLFYFNFVYLIIIKKIKVMKNFIFTVLFLVLTFTFLLMMWAENYMWASISAILLGILYIVVSNYINDQLEK